MFVTDLDHFQIAAPKGCEAEARRFFGQALGLEEIEKPETLRSRGGCWFRVGAKQLHIGVEEPFRPNAKAHPAFSVSDIGGMFTAWNKEESGASGTRHWEVFDAFMRTIHGEIDWSSQSLRFYRQTVSAPD